METCIVSEFENVGPRRSFDSLYARGLSLRDLARGSDDPQAAVMPFERDESGAWCASRWIGKFRHESVDYTVIPRIGEKRFRYIAIEAISVALLPEGAGPGRSKLHGLVDLLPLVWCLALRRARSRQSIPRLYVERCAAGSTCRAN